MPITYAKFITTNSRYNAGAKSSSLFALWPHTSLRLLWHQM